ncbi:hypothetical protein N2601_30015 (plasmid) [Rhizobium sp. CB3060]|uniref:hypothetical protein n=1 Tax=Rhizobium sp. CB3060 TaxID=3138255 RepID=UPI0021A5BE22|nr:hypothetical protein [Rhizobium tropici]UWU25671.1 hypothetical protein N2601_30015 [Rhizobium tropici]
MKTIASTQITPLTLEQESPDRLFFRGLEGRGSLRCPLRQAIAADIARQHDLMPQRIYTWRREFAKKAEAGVAVDDCAWAASLRNAQRHAGRGLYSFKQSILRSASNVLKIAGQKELNET